MALLMMLTVAYYAHKNGWGRDVTFSSARFWKAMAELAVVIGWPLLLWAVVAKFNAPAQISVFVALGLLFVLDRIFRFEALLPIMTPVLLIGGMTTGLFTPTEGAIAACVWAMILGFAWYKTLSWRMFVKVCLDTVETTSTVLFIVAAASIFGWMLTATGVTAAIASWVLAFTKEAWVFLLLANLLMLFVGCFLEPTAAITILVPHPAADRRAARHRPGPLRPGDGAQPDDRPAPSADGHGAVRAGPRRRALVRADDDGDPAVAGAAAREPRDPDLRAGDRALGAAHVHVASAGASASTRRLACGPKA
jgi:hypothetical protein